MDSSGQGLGPSEEKVLVEISKIAHRCALEVVEREMAHDVAHDVVLMCLKRMRARRWTIDPQGLHAFVVHLTRGRIIDVLRENQRRRERDAEHARECRDGAHLWMRPELAFDMTELEKLGGEELDALPRQSRLTWLLVRQQRISYKAVAKALGISHRTIRANLARAERIMRERMHEKGLGSQDGQG